MPAQVKSKMFELYPFKALGRILAWALIEGRPLTTKGRWINSVVFTLYKLSQLIPSKRYSDEPIYIIGTGRSGTTILGTLFSMHRQTMFLNEPKAAWHFAHGHEDLIGSYSLAEANVRLDPQNQEYTLIFKKLTKIYSLALRMGNSNRIVDKYPELIFRVDFLEALFPKSRFIAILRDGVDTCSSVSIWSKRKGESVNGQTVDWWGANSRKWKLLVDQIIPEHEDLFPLQNKLYEVTDHRDRAAVEWIVSMREACKIKNEKESVLVVRYEELCANTNAVLQEVLNHCCLDIDDKFFTYANTVLTETDAYMPLELMPELVTPFCNVLKAVGYGDSCKRVISRGIAK